MVELSIMTPAWQNYLKHVNDVFNERKQIARVDTLTKMLFEEYRGMITERDSWRVFFKTEQDMAFFVLKWA